jgi:hypothetical protein
MFDVSIQLLCVKKSGTLSRFIRYIKLFGLQYQSHKIDFQGDQSLILINSCGELNCTKERLAEMFGEFDEVLEVQSVKLSRFGEEITEFKTTTSNAHIEAQEPLSPAILLAAEKRLSEIIGPIASLLVEPASQSSNNVGELYLKLADELNDQAERNEFLSVIEHIDKANK